MERVEEVERFKFLKKITILIIGLSFILYFVMYYFSPFFSALFGINPTITKILPLQWAFAMFSLGLGIALTIYALFSRRMYLWFSIFLLILTVLSYVVGGVEPPSIIPEAGDWEFPVYISITAAPLLICFYLMKKKKLWLLITIVVIILSFFTVTSISIYSSHVFDIRGDVYDTVERNEAIVRRGYAYCGEFLIEPTPGVHKISWNKTFTGNESIACYFKVRLSRGERPAYALFKFNATFKKYGEFKEYGFYHSEAVLVDRRATEKSPDFIAAPFYRYASSTTDTVMSLDESSWVFYRFDVVVSYKPGIIDPDKLHEAKTDVRWKLEINILWMV